MKRSVELHLEIGVVAHLIGMTRRFVRDRIKAGDFEAFLLGNKLVVTASSVNKYMDQCRYEGAMVALPITEPPAPAATNGD